MEIWSQRDLVNSSLKWGALVQQTPWSGHVEGCWVIMLPILSSLVALHIVVMSICVASSDDKVDLIHKSHRGNAPLPYPRMHHFVTDIFPCFRCPPIITPHPQPTIPLPDQSVYHACTHFREKRSIFSWEARICLIQKKRPFFGMSPRKGYNFACIYFLVFDFLCTNVFEL